MTREEAIALFEKQLTAAQVVLGSGFGSNPGENNFLYRRRKEMAEIALTALRPVSREQVDKAWRGECDCSKLKACCTCCSMRCQYCIGQSEYKQAAFCMKCGRPLTYEAVQMVMERLEDLHDTSN